MNTLSFTRLLALYRNLCSLTAVLVTACCCVAADLSEAEKAWESFQMASKPLPKPKEWTSQQPSQEEINKFTQKSKERLIAAVDMAQDFYTRYPQDPNADRARKKEYELLLQLVQTMGAGNLAPRLETVEQGLLKVPNLDPDVKYSILNNQTTRAARLRRAEGNAAVLDEMEKGARQMIKEFPDREESYQSLLTVARQSEPERARKIADELVRTPGVSRAIQENAIIILKRVNLIGKPLEMNFEAVDGRKVNLGELKGKVVLIDFWATWCGPCIAELPKVLAAYQKLKPSGFEIIGISFDTKKEELERFVKEKGLAWPQFFDGKAWQCKYGKDFGITEIPTMWLVDKKGILRDLNARGNLESKVTKLLQE